MKTYSVVVAAFLSFGIRAGAQEARVRDLTVEDKGVPVRLMGYGLVVGLDNTGDRVTGGKAGGMTVTSVVNLLRRFDVDVPAEVVRMRNVAAVLVTAEVSPFLRPGGKFEVSIASVGDARSLRGGVLWMTPLLAEVGGKPMGSAQGAILTTASSGASSSSGGEFGGGGGGGRSQNTAENAARIPSGGLLEADLPRPQFASATRLILRDPDIGTASKIASAINKDLGDNSAKVDDPGMITLALKPDDKQDRAALFTRIRDLRVRSDRPSRLIIDARDGTIVAGGDITVNEAVVSHGGFTLSVGAAAPADSVAPTAVAAVPTDSLAAPGKPAPEKVSGNLSVTPGTQVARVAAALHAMRASAPEIAAIFEALRSVGALSAEIVIR